MNCKNCNEPLEDSWDECPYCEIPVIKTLNCSNCGRELHEKMVKCPYCKTPTGRGTATPVKNLTPSNIKTPATDPNYSRLGGFDEAQMVQPQRIQQIELSIGDTLAERYFIKKKIGQGGFGGVYSVHDNLTDKELAIKVLPFIDKSSIKNILLEFESRDRIKSFDHVIKAYQPQQAQYKGQDLIIYPMELAEKSMLEWLEETKEDLEGRLGEGLEIFKQACIGVEAIHEAGLIHLDLKPENILLTENKKAKDITQKWQVKISDFGLARGLGNTNSEILQDGIGTPAYMAPEQIMAARWKDVTAAADIYALGMILYELIDGDLPYSGTPQQIREKKRDTQIPITALQSEREVAKVAMECLEREKTKRIKSVGEILITMDKKRKEEEDNKKRREKAKELLEEGKRLVGKNKYEEALKKLKEAEELDRENAEIKGWKKETEEWIRKTKEEETSRKAEEERKQREANDKKRKEEEEGRKRESRKIRGDYIAGEYIDGITQYIERVGDKFKTGLIDKAGVKTTADDYDQMEFSYLTSSWIKVNISKGGPFGSYYGLLNHQGKEIIPPNKYDYVRIFCEGFAVVSKDYNSWGYVNLDNVEKIALRFEKADEFSEGLAAVKMGGKWGYIDKNGREVIDFKYDEAKQFTSGFAPVSIDEKWGFINKDGNNLTELIFDYAHIWFSGIKWVEKDGLYGIVKSSGSDIEFIYDGFGENCENLFSCWYNDRCGFLDLNANEVIKIKYEDTQGFSEGLAVVKFHGKWGYIDRSDKVVIDFLFEEADDFSSGLAAVKKDGRYGFINTKGEKIVLFNFHKVKSFKGSIAPICINGYWGLINKEGKVLVEPIYEDIEIVDSELCSVKLNGKWGLINKSGGKIYPCKVQQKYSLYFNKYGITNYFSEEYEFYINKNGQEIFRKNK